MATVEIIVQAGEAPVETATMKSTQASSMETAAVKPSAPVRRRVDEFRLAEDSCAQQRSCNAYYRLAFLGAAF